MADSFDGDSTRPVRTSIAVGTLRALVFDFDGTIAETERAGHRVAYNEAFAELGLIDRWDEETYGSWLHVAGGRERLGAYFRRERPELEAAEREALARRIHAAKRIRFDAIGPHIAPRPGVARLLREARDAGVRCAIATTASPDGVAAFFRGHPDLEAAFETVAAGDDVAEKKPAADIYRLVLQRLAVAPGDAVAVEDSAIGLRAARAAGIATVVTPSGYTADEDFAGAGAVLSDLGDPERAATSFAGPVPPRGFVDVAFLRAFVRAGVRAAAAGAPRRMR